MKSAIAETRIGRVTVGKIDIGELDAGPIAIGRLQLDSMHVGLQTGTARLRNLSVQLKLELEMDWSVGVDIPMVGHFGWDGTIDLGVQTIPIPLGNVTVPGLQNMSLDLATARVTNLSAAIGAIRNLHLGALVAEQIRAVGIEAPVPDFQLVGLGLDSATLRGITVPGAALSESRVAHVHGQALPLGTVTIPNVAMPSASVGNISSEAIDASATANPLVLEADAGVLSISLKVTPTASMSADELRLSNVRATTSIGSISLQDVVLPYDVLDIKLSQIGIETIEVPAVEVS